ncbi:uncharacterized protein DNG_04453 [Cephalotrichum gorgonifer]|uniref:Uncharacterized protein n=1 Tax=Cephalotrichum gorgonifer TaxID=2041049 RepID=A0AAE8MYS4_9PEZI|nr:uncharacterized protein DNG_04453 [Cephalotrichum gorgonifer]
MPYYLHASVVLFQSTLYRVDGDFVKSESTIRDFMFKGPQPETRRDRALQGRLHISQLDNKIRVYDRNAASFIYRWEAEQPLSSLEMEVTSRLQGVAARYFQSIGDFEAARASLEQFLSLDSSSPIRANTRRLLIGRLADLYCETEEYAKVVDILQPELDSITAPDRSRRPFRRLMLALVEANIGLDRLQSAELLIQDLGEYSAPLELDNLHDQQLHMRRLLAVARIAHMRSGNHHQAVLSWSFCLKEVAQMHTLKAKGGFTAAMIYLSLARAQLGVGNEDDARNSWAAGTEILRSEKCEFWIPIVPTIWLRKIATEVYELRGNPILE